MKALSAFPKVPFGSKALPNVLTPSTSKSPSTTSDKEPIESKELPNVLTPSTSKSPSTTSDEVPIESKELPNSSKSPSTSSNKRRARGKKLTNTLTPSTSKSPSTASNKLRAGARALSAFAKVPSGSKVLPNALSPSPSRSPSPVSTTNENQTETTSDEIPPGTDDLPSETSSNVPSQVSIPAKKQSSFKKIFSKLSNKTPIETTTELPSYTPQEKVIYEMDDNIRAPRNNVRLVDELIINEPEISIDKIVNKAELAKLSEDDTKKLIAQIVKNKVRQSEKEKRKILITGAVNSMNYIDQKGGLLSDMSESSDSNNTINYESLSDFEPINSNKKTVFIGTNLNREDNIINKALNFMGIQFLKN